MSRDEITREFLLNGTRRNGPGFEANQREAAQRLAKGCRRSATPTHSTHFPNSPESFESPGVATAPSSSGASLGTSRNTLLDVLTRDERREHEDAESGVGIGLIGGLICLALAWLA